MMSTLITAAERRYYERLSTAESVLHAVPSSPLHELNTPAAVEKRIEHIDTFFRDSWVIKERIFGNPDFLPINFLEKGTKVARTVGRIVIRNAIGNIKGYGTGFLVSPRLMLTNQHVLLNADMAKHCLGG